MAANRRELLALSGAVLAGISGCSARDRSDPGGSDGSGSGGRSDGNATERRVRPDADYEIGFRQAGIEAEAWTEVADVVSESRTQGIAYRDGRIYVAGTEEGSHSTVYEFRRDGTPTGDAHTFGDGGHVNCLQWRGGDLWAVGFTAGAVYRTDFETGTVRGSFEYGNGTVLDGSPNNFVFVPTAGGDDRMIVVGEFGNATGHVIDYESALEDGTAAGNVDARIDAGLFENADGAHYRDGDAYFTHFPGGPARGAAFRVSLPDADKMNAAFRIAPDDVEWYHPFETWSESGHVQDLTYDAEEEVWYLVSDDDAQTVYRGPERVHATVPKPWTAWTAEESERYGAALRIDSSAGTRRLPIFAAPRSNLDVVVPFYDDGSRTDARVAVGVDDGSERTTGLGVNTAAETGAANYLLRDGSWADTGVSRAEESWVLFGFEATGRGIDARISTDDGRSWTDAGETTGASGVAALAVHSQAADGAGIRVGSFSIDAETDA